MWSAIRSPEWTGALRLCRASRGRVAARWSGGCAGERYEKTPDPNMTPRADTLTPWIATTMPTSQWN